MNSLSMDQKGQSYLQDRTSKAHSKTSVNVGEAERWGSIAAGGMMLWHLLRHGKVGSVALALIGGSLIQRGLTGHCHLYNALEISSNDNQHAVKHGIKITKSVTINKSPEDLFQFWRNLENLPTFMDHLIDVRQLDGNRSHWIAKAPAGAKVEWDAEIINEKENELLAWQSVEDSDIENVGSVRFSPAPGGRGTEVRVEMQYAPPAGKLGVAIGKLLHEEPSIQIDEDLQRFKQLMEAGEISTTNGQPTGKFSRQDGIA